MKAELANFRISPRVFMAGKATEISISPRGAHASFDDRQSYEVRFVPMEESIEPKNESEYPTINIKPSKGALHFTYSFPSEQMYLIRILKDDERLYNFPVYALNADLYERRPLKGDLHVHSCYSDGQEEPAVVAANYRKNGFDFLAITDHSKWQPSKEAIDRYAGIPTDLSLFNGEEIHVSGHYIHAVNFGGASVNEYYYANEEKCEGEIAELAKQLPSYPGIDPMDYARRVWISREIRKAKGLSIFVHPHWINNAYNVPDKVSMKIFENKDYDAFELLGGQTVFENNMQTALYNEMRALGVKIPVVGSSDSHGTEPAVYFNEEFTLVFAKDRELSGICSAIKDGYSLAVENRPGQEQRAFGQYRMVKYGLFIVNEYLPEYLELCFEQGRAMKELVTGNDEALEILKLLKGRTDKYYERFFGRNAN